jgi:quinol monooxygenase YgiN
MRKLLFLLIAFTFTALPANAQTPAPQHGLKTGYIAAIYTGEVLSGQTDNFKLLVTRIVAAVAKEPGMLVYEWSFQPDQKTYNVLEVYRDSDAVVAHAKHFVPTFGKELAQVRKTISYRVFGTPDARAKQVLARLNPIYGTPIDGFIR